MPRDTAVLVGSLRAGSLTRKTAHALAALSPDTMAFEIVEIGNLPFYNQDIEEEGAPQSWTVFRERIQSADGLLFVTPEYNRSVPAALKNAIDVGSRPSGQSVWNGKPGGVVSVSPGALGGFGANQHLRQSLVTLNVLVMQQPEAYYSRAGDYFDESGILVNEATRKVMARFAQAFARWVEFCLDRERS